MKLYQILILLCCVIHIPLFQANAAVVIDDGLSGLCVEPKGIDHYFVNDGESGVSSDIIGLTGSSSGNPYVFRSDEPITPQNIEITVRSNSPSTTLDNVLYRLLPYPDRFSQNLHPDGLTYSQTYGLQSSDNYLSSESTIPYAMFFSEYDNNAHGVFSHPGGSTENISTWQTSDGRIDYQKYIQEEVFPSQKNNNSRLADNTTSYIPMFIACVQVVNSETDEVQAKSFPIYSDQLSDGGINLTNTQSLEAFYAYTSSMTQMFTGEWATEDSDGNYVDETRRFSDIATGNEIPDIALDQESEELAERLVYEPRDGVNCADPESWLGDRWVETGVYDLPEDVECAGGSCSVFSTISGFFGDVLSNARLDLGSLINGDSYTLYLFTDTHLDSMAKNFNRKQDQAFWEITNMEGITDIPGDPSFTHRCLEEVSQADEHLCYEWYDQNDIDICVNVSGAGSSCRPLSIKTPTLRPIVRYCQMLEHTQIEGVLEAEDNPDYISNNCDEILDSIYNLETRYPNLGRSPGTIDTGDFEIEINVARAELFGNDISSMQDEQRISNEALPTVLRWNVDITAKHDTRGLRIDNIVSVYNNTFDEGGNVNGEVNVQSISRAPFLLADLNGQPISQIDFIQLLGDSDDNGDNITTIPESTFSNQSTASELIISEEGYVVGQTTVSGRIVDQIQLRGELVDLRNMEIADIVMKKGDTLTLVFETSAPNAAPYPDSRVEYEITVDGIEIDKAIKIADDTVFMGLYGRLGRFGWASLRKANTPIEAVDLVDAYIDSNYQKIPGLDRDDVVGMMSVNVVHGSTFGCPTNYLDVDFAQELVNLAESRGMVVMFDIQPVRCSEDQLKAIMDKYYLGDNVTFDIDLEWARPNIKLDTVNNLVDYYYNDLAGTVPFFGVYYFSVTERYLDGDFSDADPRIFPLMDGFGSCGAKSAVTDQMLNRFGRNTQASDQLNFGIMEFVTAHGNRFDKCSIQDTYNIGVDKGARIFIGQ